MTYASGIPDEIQVPFCMLHTPIADGGVCGKACREMKQLCASLSEVMQCFINKPFACLDTLLNCISSMRSQYCKPIARPGPQFHEDVLVLWKYSLTGSFHVHARGSILRSHQTL
eukprot:6340903-Amphidinium_carterae.1